MRLDHSHEDAEVRFEIGTKTLRVGVDYSNGWCYRKVISFSDFRRRYCPNLFKRANPFRKVLWRYIKTRPRHFLDLLKEFR